VSPTNDGKSGGPAIAVGPYPTFDARGADEVFQRLNAAGTEEIHPHDILEEVPLGDDAVPSLAPLALSVTPPPIGVDAEDLAKTRVLSPRRRSIAPRIIAGALALVASLVAVIGFRLYEARLPRAVSSVTVVHATRPPPPPDEKQLIPTVPLDNLPVVPSSLGKLRFAPNAKGHRVYVDGALVGEPSDTLDVKCGPRMVKVGSRGAVQTIEVPCGGEVLVSLR
jgi:hypothetical protein